MKEKIKNKYAVKNGFDDWEDLLCNALPDFVRFAINEVMELYVNQEVEKRIAERINKEMTPENALRYFNNHFDCYTDVDINNFLTTEQAMTRSGVIKMFEMLRSRLTNDSQKTEGGGE